MKIISFEEACNMSERELSKALYGSKISKVIEKWGKPDGTLANIYGKYYFSNDGKSKIVLYYYDGIIEDINIEKINSIKK